MTHQVCFTLECRNQRISSTSALIMLSHNDRGISALIMGDPLYIEHMALKADSSWPDKQGAFIHMSMVFHGPSSCQNSRRSDKKWTKNNVPDIIKEMKLSDYEATYRAHDPWGYEKVKFVAMSHVHYTLTRKTPRCSVFTWPRGSVINTKQLTVLCKFWNFKGSEFNLFQPCVLLCNYMQVVCLLSNHLIFSFWECTKMNA